MGSLTKKQVEELFKNIDAKLQKQIDLFVIGGVSAVLGYNVTKITDDVDIDGKVDSELDTLFNQEAKKLNLDLYLSSKGVFFPPEDYRSRAHFTDYPKNKLRVWFLNQYDLAISKIDRGLDKDYDDIKRVHEKSPFDRNQLINLFNDEYINVVATGNLREKKMNLIDLISNLFGDSAVEDTKKQIKF